VANLGGKINAQKSPSPPHWTYYPIAWSELIAGWGTPIALDPKSNVALDIAPSASSAIDFDIWIDTFSSCTDFGKKIAQLPGFTADVDGRAFRVDSRP
jgi:hypothetical protein